MTDLERAKLPDVRVVTYHHFLNFFALEQRAKFVERKTPNVVRTNRATH